MRRYRIRVEAERGLAHVMLKRRWTPDLSSYITVAKIMLAGDDAEDRLADARARATTLAHQVNGLERDRP